MACSKQNKKTPNNSLFQDFQLNNLQLLSWLSGVLHQLRIKSLTSPLCDANSARLNSEMVVLFG